MIFWKEWRVVRGRFLTLAAFYGITLLLLPFESIAIGEMFDVHRTTVANICANRRWKQV